MPFSSAWIKLGEEVVTEVLPALGDEVPEVGEE